MPDTYIPPVSAAEAEEQALRREYAEKMLRGPKVPMPGGNRIDARPYIGMAYQGPDATAMLANPEIILKAPKVGCLYVWKSPKDRQSQAWTRSGIYRPVETSEVDTSNPLAEYVEVVTATGTYVQWESLRLYEMAEKWVKKHYIGPQEWAIARLAHREEAFQELVKERTRGAYKGSFKVGDKGNQ